MSPRAIKGVCFDVSGTIVQNERVHDAVVREVFAAVSAAPLEDDELRAYHNLSYTDRLTHLLAMRGIDDDAVVAQLAEQARDLYQQRHTVQHALVPGIAAFMQYVHERNVKIAVVSSLTHRAIEEELTQAQLLQFVRVIVGADDVSTRKPHPEPYERALEQLGVQPAETIAFEDSPPGVESAWLAGIPVVGVLTNFSAEELEKTFYIIRDYRGLTLDMLI